MAIPETQLYARSDKQTVYLKNAVKNPNIVVGDYTFYNDWERDRRSLNGIMCCITIPSTAIGSS
jgi:virginiamycin A acetyltransferase